MTVPQARSEDLVVEELDGEVLIYDSRNQRAHCLAATAARVWRACDGTSDVDALAGKLGLKSEEVVRAIDELRASELLEDHGLTIVDGSSGSSSVLRDGLTRRQFTKVGAAAAATPLIYSIAVNTPMAAATPTPFQCEIFTTQDCGASSGCGSIAGCCCCCTGGGSCKTCGSVKFCNATPSTQPCAPIQGGGVGSGCADAKGTNPPTPSGCCGVTGSTSCGCGFGPFAGCCNPTTKITCTPTTGTTTCFPCCAGQQIQSSAVLGCCKSSSVNCCDPSSLTAAQQLCCNKSQQKGTGNNATFVDCCTNPNTTCCQKSSATQFCCGDNPPPCCNTTAGCS